MTVLFSDDFSTDKSADYDAFNSGTPPTRVADQFVITDFAARVWNGDATVEDGYIQIGLIVQPTSGVGEWGVAWRDVDGDGGNAYQIVGDSAGCAVQKFVSGSPTTLASFAAVGNNATVRVQFGGRCFFVYVNGVLVATSFGDSAFSTGYCAFFGGFCTFDNFEIGSMDEPYLVGVGTAVNGTGNVNPTAGAGYATNDVFDLLIESCGGEAANLGTANGFAAQADSPSATGTTTNGTRLTAYWKRAASGAETFPTVTDPGNHAYAQILTWRNCITSGDPWDVTAAAQKASASTSASGPGDTTTVPNTAIRVAIARDNDSAAAAFSAWANADLTLLAEVSDAGTTDGNGGGFGVLIGVKAAAGAFTTTTATVTSSINASHTIAFKPPVSGATAVAADTNTPTDSAVALTSRVAVGTDTNTPTDSAVSISQRLSVAVDTNTPTDEAVSISTRLSVAEDTNTPTDSAEATTGFPAEAADTNSPTDSAEALTSRVAEAADTNTPTDSAVSITARLAVAEDTNTPTDSAQGIPEFPASAEDTNTPTDSAVSITARLSVAEDTNTPTDEAVSISARLSVAEDTNTPTDSAEAGAQLPSVAADTNTPTDSAVATNMPAGSSFGADTNTPTDEAVAITQRTAMGEDFNTPSDSAICIGPGGGTAYKYIDGTAFDRYGRMMTVPVGIADPLPATAKYIMGIAHSQNGRRYVTRWPGAVTRHIDGFALRADGVQVVAPDASIDSALAGIPVTYRRETVVSDNYPSNAVGGWGLDSAGRLTVTNHG